MKRVLLSLGILFGLAFAGQGLLAPAHVSAADPKSEVCRGIGSVDGSGNCTKDNTLSRVIKNAINLFSVVVGIVAVVMIMVSGFKYITANGDSGSLTSAKQTLLFAIVGLVIVALSQSIVRFVLGKVT